MIRFASSLHRYLFCHPVIRWCNAVLRVDLGLAKPNLKNPVHAISIDADADRRLEPIQSFNTISINLEPVGLINQSGRCRISALL